METDPLLADLTEPQRQAVLHLDGPLLVLAGPGSGKTMVVTRRVARLIAEGIPAWQILALTFTNKAAAEMRTRIEAMLPPDVPGRRGLTIATFHAFCARLLRRYAYAAGLSPRFSIYDAADQRDAIKRGIEEVGLNTSNWQPPAVAAAISNAKNRLLGADAYAAEASDFYTRSIAKVYRVYEKTLDANSALDFDDLLLRVARLLRECEPVRRELQQRYQYVLIDEYQDTNHAQFVIAHVLAAAHANIFVVGDPDQSIYGWRGADIGNILEFEEHYPSATVVALGQNFRSTSGILDTADHLIRHNRRRKHKPLFSDLGMGESPMVILCRDEHHEAQVVADELRRCHEKEAIAWCDMAVLYRVNALSRVLEQTLRDGRIPYVIARGTAFYDRKEVKDAIAYLRLLANPDDDVALRRVINTPPRGIGKTTLNRIEIFAIDRQLGLLEAMGRADKIEGVSSRSAAAVLRFVAMVKKWMEITQGPFAPDDGGLRALVERVIVDSRLERTYQRSATEEDRQRLANLQELVSAAADFVPPVPELIEDTAEVPSVLSALGAYLESVALVSDADMVDPEKGVVTLMTLHAAKGLEFSVVIMAGLEEGLLPHIRAAENDHELEEERRLCFVGITRAKRHLFFTRAAVRTQRGLRLRTMGSRFLKEMPADGVVVSDQAGDVVLDEQEYAADDSHGRGVGGGEHDRFPVGCLVCHKTFGVGRVEAIMPRARGASARISFRSVGTKTLVLGFAPLERVEEVIGD